jgi:hypothetical protein
MTAIKTDSLPLKGVIALARANKKIERETMAFLQEHELTLAQFAVLEVLLHKGELSIKEIIEKNPFYQREYDRCCPELRAIRAD